MILFTDIKGTFTLVGIAGTLPCKVTVGIINKSLIAYLENTHLLADKCL